MVKSRLAQWLRSLSDYLDPASRPALHTYRPWEPDEIRSRDGYFTLDGTFVAIRNDTVGFDPIDAAIMADMLPWPAS